MSLETIERRVRFWKAITETRRAKLIKAEQELQDAEQELTSAYADYREQGGDLL